MNKSQHAMWACTAAAMAVVMAATTASLAHAEDASASAGLQLEEVTDSKTAGATARADYQFGNSSFLEGHSFSAITSIDHWRMFDYQDIDGTDSPFLLDFPLAAPSGINSGAAIRGYFHAKSYTQEFRLTSPDDTRLRYVTGLWYARNDLDRFLARGPVLQQAKYLATSTNENYSAYVNATRARRTTS
jgi:iron complex outermembrane recepter protein